ncbi:MAG: A24 family peptidase [Gammaproteobacteria bacterium]|nr:A24 family peptidase [Gammaproteobacteria bacterium]MDP2140165.1 A24 family peptidase [Gammaproteobacteria bacterium]MDP2348041.1 A24 family peptidase [Gammaproteobacteria bacterium]
MTVIDLIVYDPAARLIFAAIIGLLVGSFLNVVIYRVPAMLQREWRQQCCEYLELDEKKFSKDDPTAKHKVFNLVKPDSHCPQCNAPVRAWQNIPVFSYLFLGGKCAKCSKPISIRYPIIEAVTGLLSVLVVWQFGAMWLTLALLVLTWSLIALTMIDFDHQLLPDNITMPLLWLGLLVNTLLPESDVGATDAVIGAVVGYLSLWSLYWAFKLLTGKEGMGYGDFKLLGALGAWMGWQSLLLIVILSSLVGAVVGISLLVFRGRDRNIPIPFGPYLAGAGFIALLWGDTLSSLYLNTL